jgi:5-methylcytosine-specific restriction protein A
VACLFDFKEKYGGIGERYIHVHHLKPLAEIKKEYELDPIKDLRPICPNCHAIIHRRQPALTIEQLRQHMTDTKNGGAHNKG